MSIDPHNQTWLAVKAHAGKAMEKARDRLEATGTDLAATEYQRGYIRAMRDVLALAEPRQVIPDSDPKYI